MPNPLKTRRGRIAAIVGGLVGVVGVALAAFLIAANVTGSVSFRDQNADFRVTASGTVGNNGMDCTNTRAIGDRDITVNPVITRFTSPGQPAQVPDQSCRVTMRVDNTGDVPLTVSGFSLGNTSGVTVNPVSAPTTIAAGAGADYIVDLVVPAGSQPTAGGFSGQLRFTS